MNRVDALARVRSLAGLPAPLSAAAYYQEQLYLRLSGNGSSVHTWAEKIGGETTDSKFWSALRDHELDFFRSPQPLWRLVVPPATPELPCEEQGLLDWGGGQRWVYSQASADTIRTQVADLGGHATLFRNAPPDADVFHPLAPAIATLHRGLKKKFDPLGTLNPGKMYADW